MQNGYKVSIYIISEIKPIDISAAKWIWLFLQTGLSRWKDFACFNVWLSQALECSRDQKRQIRDDLQGASKNGTRLQKVWSERSSYVSHAPSISFFGVHPVHLLPLQVAHFSKFEGLSGGQVKDASCKSVHFLALKPSCCGQHDPLLLPKLCRPFWPSALAWLAYIFDGLLSERNKHRVYGIRVGWMSG